MSVARVAVVVAWLLHAAIALAQPAPPAVTTERAEMSGITSSVDIYRPSERETQRVAILAHGFWRNRSRQRDLGRDLAAAGIVALAPDLPSVVDYWSNADAVIELVREIERGAFGLAPLPRSRIVLIGTSAGAVATLIAASKLRGLAGWIGLDPVDRSGIARHAAARLDTPAIVLLGDASICNLFRSGRAIAEAAPTLIRADRIRGASHCDFEGPTERFCRNACGGSSPEMAARVRDETVDAAQELYDRAVPGEAPERRRAAP